MREQLYSSELNKVMMKQNGHQEIKMLGCSEFTSHVYQMVDYIDVVMCIEQKKEADASKNP